MRGILLPGLRAALVTWALCGLAYPLVVTGLAQWLLPFEADGSLVKAPDGRVLGSRLIGQQWTGREWFHGRPSATDPPYDAGNSGGSNLGPRNPILAQRLTAARRALVAQQPELAGHALPADMLTASGSGLDPDISPADAALQVPRIAQARGIPAAEIAALVRQQTTGRSLGIFGEPRVNVLSLNLALQRLRR
jgi:potassium-transporting ATPase KdpC subunit